MADTLLGIPVCRPLLPGGSELEKYLVQIDANRWYTNHGQLALEFEERIASHFGLSRGSIISANSGSSALFGAILGSAGRATSEMQYCFCPSFSFIATASTPIHCGYTPYFVDIDEQTWCIDPMQLLAHPQIERAGLVIPVAPYGRQIDLESWADFHRRTGIPVVVDAAACFDTLWLANKALPSGILVAMSLHATKVLSTAEGGLILSADEKLLQKCWAVLNHGFSGQRISRVDSINGKLSEYHAAVGLASLDQWPRTQAGLRQLAGRYANRWKELGAAGNLQVANRVSGAYALLESESASVCDRIEVAMSDSNISTVRWYGRGLHNEPAFAACPRDDLPVTESVCARTLGLPFFVDMTDPQIDELVRTVGQCSLKV